MPAIQHVTRRSASHPRHVAVQFVITYEAGHDLRHVYWEWATRFKVGQTGVGLRGMPGFPWRVEAIYREPKDTLRQAQRRAPAVRARPPPTD